MQKANQISQQINNQITTAKDGRTDSTQQQTHLPTSLTGLDRQIIERLFDQLKAIFPKWREVWATDGEIGQAKKQWTRVLVRRQVADPQIIKLGLLKAEATGWVRPPSAGQFADWCFEVAMENAGIPPKDKAVREVARARHGSSVNRTEKLPPALYQMSRYVDWFRYNHATVEKAEKILEAAYDDLVEHWKSGKPFENPPVAIEKRDNPSGVVRTKKSRDEAKKILSGLIEGLK